MGELNKAGQVLKFGEAFQKGGQGSFCSETFYNGCKNLIEMPKCVATTKVAKASVAHGQRNTFRRFRGVRHKRK